jgi:hypothetical protein
MDVAAAGGTVPEPEPSYLVEITPVPTQDVYLLVVARTDLDPLDRRTLEAALGDERLDAFRTTAAAHGAERVFLDETRTPTRRRVYAFGYSKTRTSHLGLTPPACEGVKAVEAKARAARRSRRCLMALRAKRPGLSATVKVRYRIDPFGDLMRAVALPESSRDSQVQACVTDALASITYPRPPSLFCSAELEMTVP